LTQQEILSASPEEARRMLIELTSFMPLLIARASSGVGSIADTAQDELLNADHAAPILKMHPKSLKRWTECPFLIVRGRRKFYSSKGMANWIAEQMR
jgi:hypothetical protein